jgi:GNAT superfamily N-acetyltransferase
VSDDLPAGWTTRQPTPADAAEVTALVLACDLDVLGHSDATVEQTAADLAAPGFDPERGGLLVHDRGGTLVGWLWTEDTPSAGAVFVDPYSLDPAVTGWLMRRGLEYVRELARERAAPVAVRAGSYEHDGDLAATFEQAGLTVQRRFWRMRIDLGDSPWVMPEPAPGVVLRNPDPALESTYVELHGLIEASFAEHWGHTPNDYPTWRQRFDTSAGLDPTQWWVADVHGSAAALLMGDDSRGELGMGWVRILGVLTPYRGLGLGRLLLRTAFAQAASRGRTAVGLGVDSENATGATALYASVGMYPESVLLAWRGVVDP